jgi:hypothetical protein
VRAVVGSRAISHNARMTDPGARPLSRPRGLVALAVLVATGVGVTAGYLQWKAPDLLARRAATRREVASASATFETRLATWVRFGDPQVHNRIQMMRLSERQPVLVTHAIGVQGGEVELFGVDLSDLPRALLAIDGSTLRLRVPAPRSLGRGRLAGEQTDYIPVFADRSLAPDPKARLEELLGWALKELSGALERDLPGARLVIEVGPETDWAAIASNRALASPSPP